MKHMKTVLWFLSIALCAFLVLSIFTPKTVFAAEGDTISDLALAYGTEGVQMLEESGYTVMGRPLTGDYWLGYKKGGSAVTGLVVSPGESGTVNVDGITYQRVGGLGTAGSLYITRDAAAGDAVLSLSLQSDEGFVDQPLYALKNDGTSPLRRNDGTPCNLSEGQTTYLYLLRENVFHPYISSVTVVSGTDLRAAVLAAAAAGCDYYYDPDLKTTDGRIVVIGYTRTAKETDAITCIAAGTEAPELEGVAFDAAGDVLVAGDPDYRLYETRDPSVGNPIVRLTGSAVPVRASDVMNKWAEKTFVKFNTSAASVNLVKNEALYQEYLKDSSQLTNVPVLIPSEGENIVTPLAYTCKAEGMPAEIFPETEETEESESESEDESEDESDDESGSESEEESDTEADIESSTASEAESATETDTESSDTETETETDTESSTETDIESTTESDTGSGTEIDIDSDTERITESAEELDTLDYLEEKAEKIADDSAPDAITASVFGAGTLTGVICVLIFIALDIAGGFLVVAIRNRKQRGKEEHDEN